MNSETYVVIYAALGEIKDVLWAGNKIRAKMLLDECEVKAKRSCIHYPDYEVGVFRLTGTPPKCEEVYDFGESPLTNS